MRWARRLFATLLQAAFQRWAFKKLERRALLFYLKSLQVVRKTAISVLLLIFVFQLFFFCFIGLVISGVLLAVEDPQLRLWIFFIGSASFFFIVSVLLWYLLSDRFWYRLANINGSLDKLRDDAA